MVIRLNKALQIEQKRRKKGKQLNLLGEDDVGPQFWSPCRIQAALRFQDEKDAKEQANQQRIADNKAQAVANKSKKEAKKAERALQTAARRQHALEEKARKAKEKAQKQAQRQAEKEAKALAKASKKAAKPTTTCKARPPLPKTPKKQVVVNESSSGKKGSPRSVKPVPVKSSRTRTVRMPQRFRSTT